MNRNDIFRQPFPRLKRIQFREKVLDYEVRDRKECRHLGDAKQQEAYSSAITESYLNYLVTDRWIAQYHPVDREDYDDIKKQYWVETLQQPVYIDYGSIIYYYLSHYLSPTNPERFDDIAPKYIKGYFPITDKLAQLHGFFAVEDNITPRLNSILTFNATSDGLYGSGIARSLRKLHEKSELPASVIKRNERLLAKYQQQDRYNHRIRMMYLEKDYN